VQKEEEEEEEEKKEPSIATVLQMKRVCKSSYST
jgi:hypothetical protein